MMIKKMIRLVICSTLATSFTAVDAMEFHVSPSGSDGNSPGTETAPFASLLQARDAIRARRQQGQLKDETVVVTIHAGVYRITQSLQLDSQDSGTEGAPVIWQAAPDAQVRLVGGVPLTNWKPVTDHAVLERLDESARERVFQTDLNAAGVGEDLGMPTPSGGPRSELIFNTRYMTLARYPNDDWLKIVSIPEGDTLIETERDSHAGHFEYPGERPTSWQDTTALWVHGYWVHDWSDQYHRIQTLDLDKHEIWPQPPYHHYGYSRGARFYFLNILEELDTPGEWFLDRDSGIAYFWPPGDLEQGEASFPQLQEPMLVLKGTEHVSIRRLIFESSRDQAIVIEGGSHNEIAGCTIRNMGAREAIVIGGTHNRIQSCDVYELAGAGITLEGGDRATLTPAGNEAVNCDVHHVGRVYRTYHGAFNLRGVGNRIAHCWIHQVPHQGVGYSGNDHIIEYCDFERVAEETGDVGAIYAAADWTFMGNEFRYNYFHNIHGPGQLGCNTIYPDLPVGGIHLHHNIFFDVDQGFYTNSGRGMVIENNFFVRTGRAIGFGVWTREAMFQEGGSWRMVEKLKEVNYDQPPYSTRYPALLQLADDFSLGVDEILQRELPKDNLIRRNISWGSGVFVRLGPAASLEHVRVEENLIADEIVFGGSFDGDGSSRTFRRGNEEVEQVLGALGNRMVEGDPGFGGLRTQDFALSDDSPAHAMGIEPIPLHEIGLQLDEYRTSLPLLASDPVLYPASSAFVGGITVELTPTPRAGGPLTQVRYTTDGSEPSMTSSPYEGAIRITESTTVKAAAFAVRGDSVGRSNTVTAEYRATSMEDGAIFLSDMEEEDFFAYPEYWFKDENYRGYALKLGGLEYAKGIILHPDTDEEGTVQGRVSYRLSGPMRDATFAAVIGIDDSMEAYSLGSSVFIVEVQRNGGWSRVFESSLLKLGAPPEEVTVKLDGADRLRLIVTDGEDGTACDHALWAHARIF